MKKVALLYMLFQCVSLLAWPVNKEWTLQLIDKIREKYLSIKDYQADINININVEFINIPDKKAHVYFKQPDKIKYESENFILLPKKNMDFSLKDILNTQFTSVYVGKENTDSVESEVVKIIPLDPASEIVLATLWIDANNARVIKIEANTRKNGSYIMNMIYNKISDILPQQVKVTFELTKMEIPFSFLLDSKPMFFNHDEGKQQTLGTVIISYSNYKINSGIPDTIFNDSKDKTNRKK